MRLLGTKLAANSSHRGFGDQLYDLAGERPSLDLNFANTKTLTDSATSTTPVTFTRASSGTYVDSQGVIQRATTNLLLRSEEFNDASWTKQSSVSVSANTVIAPNGTLTADTVTADSGLGIFQTITSVIGVNYSNSIYVKAGTATSIMFRDDTGAGRHIVFNPSTGVITSTSGTFVSFGSQAVGDGWYRYWIVYAADTTSVRGIVRPNSAGSAQTFAVWGAQLEQSSTVGEYIPTTSTINSAPRFDHSPTTGESLGLLVEESRTNLLLQSNGFDTTWTNSNSSETAAAGTAPDGTNTAWELKDTNDSGVATTHNLNQAGISFVSGTSYTFSLWAKSGTLSFITMLLPASGFTTQLAVRFNLANGTNTGVPAGVTVSSTAFPGGWYRISMTATATATASGTIIIRTAIAGSSSYAGDGTGTILIWGAQLEAGAFPTSYIPTTTATATRSADVASITGTNFSSWYRQDEGTVFYDGQALGSDPATNKNLLGVSNGSGNNTIDLFIPSGVNQRFRIANGGVSQVLQNTLPTANVYSPAKVAYAFKLDDATSAGNGTVLATDTSCTIPSVDRFTFGVLATGEAQVAARYKRLTFWPTRLPNETLQGITQ